MDQLFIQVKRFPIEFLEEIYIHCFRVLMDRVLLKLFGSQSPSHSDRWDEVVGLRLTSHPSSVGLRNLSVFDLRSKAISQAHTTDVRNERNRPFDGPVH